MMMQFLQALGLSESTELGNKLRQGGDAAVCMSCDLPIVLEWKSIVSRTNLTIAWPITCLRPTDWTLSSA